MTGLMLMALVGFTGIAIDVAWYHLNTLRIQRAADASALAGVVYLPGNVAGANTAARAEATKNGYTTGVNGAVVTVAQDPINTRLIVVTIKGSAKPFFARFFGVNAITAQRRARAEFILPVPMGSPQPYFGVQRLCRNSDNPVTALPGGCPQVASASGVGTLATQGFWATIESKGQSRENGDAYSTYYNPRTSATNTGFDANGYSYIVEFPAGVVNGKVWIYDPMHCATGIRTATNNRLGVGDYWIGVPSSGSTSDQRRVSTAYKLWDMNGTPYSTVDDTVVVTTAQPGGLADSVGLFLNDDYVDKGTPTSTVTLYEGNGIYGGSYAGGSSADCSLNPFHNAWWLLASGLGQGDYRLQVTTNVGTNNLSQLGVNGFSIEVTADSGLTGARVYGQSRMCILVNVPGTAATFYLAQVEAVHAGKTLEIKLFDPGDFQNTFLRIKQPTPGGYTDASFNFTSTGSACCSAPTSGGPVAVIQTSSTSNWYNNHWLTLTIPLPTSYSAPTPPGEPGPGWWKIQYTTGSTGIDITTWEVNIRGNPVHLVIP